MRWKLQSERREALKEDLGALIAVIAFVSVMLAAAALPGLLSDASSTVPMGSSEVRP
jgi:hypothetical protein